MTEEGTEKTDLDKARDVISQLKEMRHYSKTNIEKLGEFWLLMDGELKQKEVAGRVEALLDLQNAFHEAVESLITDYEAETSGEGEAPP